MKVSCDCEAGTGDLFKTNWFAYDSFFNSKEIHYIKFETNDKSLPSKITIEWVWYTHTNYLGEITVETV